MKLTNQKISIIYHLCIQVGIHMTHHSPKEALQLPNVVIHIQDLVIPIEDIGISSKPYCPHGCYPYYHPSTILNFTFKKSPKLNKPLRNRRSQNFLQAQQTQDIAPEQGEELTCKEQRYSSCFEASTSRTKNIQKTSTHPSAFHIKFSRKSIPK